MELGEGDQILEGKAEDTARREAFKLQQPLYRTAWKKCSVATTVHISTYMHTSTLSLFARSPCSLFQEQSYRAGVLGLALAPLCSEPPCPQLTFEPRDIIIQQFQRRQIRIRKKSAMGEGRRRRMAEDKEENERRGSLQNLRHHYPTPIFSHLLGFLFFFMAPVSRKETLLQPQCLGVWAGGSPVG